MDRTLNPYSPGAGLKPRALVGRDEELELVTTMVTRIQLGLHNRGVIFHGLRGVGKTVLLNELASRAEAADWLVVRIEAAADKTGSERARASLARELTVGARKLSVRKKWRHLVDSLPVIASFSVNLGFSGASLGVEPRAGWGDSGDIGIDLEELVLEVAGSAAKDGKAVAFFIDEMQDLDPALMSAVIRVQHLAGQRDLPFYVFGAGLPTLPQILAGVQSYAERLFEYHRIGKLSQEASREALESPARTVYGAEFEEMALARLTDASDRYPYFLQEFGKAIWDVAPQSPFTEQDAELAIRQGITSLDEGFFPSRWERATQGERRFLIAMAEAGDDVVLVSELADSMGKTVSSVSATRRQLIEKGLVFSPKHGFLQFTVPGMAQFIRRHNDDLEE